MQRAKSARPTISKAWQRSDSGVRRLRALRRLRRWQFPPARRMRQAAGGSKRAATEESRVAPVAHPRGTTVDVSDLFYNTPARRKFLKTERTELAHLNDIVTRLALGRLDVEFETPQRHDGAIPAGERQDGLRRVAQLLGEGFAAAAVPSTKRTTTCDCTVGSGCRRFRARRPIISISSSMAARSKTSRRLCGEAGVSGRAVPWPSSGVRAVSRSRSAAGRCQRAPDQVRGAVPGRAGVRDFVFGSLNRALRNLRAGSAPGARVRACSNPTGHHSTFTTPRPVPGCYSRSQLPMHSEPRQSRIAPVHDEGLALVPACRRRVTFRPLAMPLGNCMRSTSLRRMPTDWSSWTCTPRTSGSPTRK